MVIVKALLDDGIEHQVPEALATLQALARAGDQHTRALLAAPYDALSEGYRL